MNLPSDYSERVYAGVLGKTIGVYLGRPFEGWTYERIQKRLGDIEYYVHDRVGVPLLVTDDDIAGTFTFLRAMGDHHYNPQISSAEIGESWLNYLIENKTILWWGGLGNSTEHTAYLRLKKGIQAPQSGSAALNSKVVSEQIGAQIFIDGWAMVSPGDAGQAARLAEQAARVSHDGEAVYGAVVLAVMEAMAFVETDLNKLLDVALGYIPADSVIRRLIDDLRDWHAQDADWRAARERLEAVYGYDKYGGNCHMVPNHGLIVLALLHGNDDFSETLKIINTSGWDTDCNSGNVGCLMGIKNGLAGIDAGLERGLDWRTPVADRIYVSSADPTWGVSDCVLESQYIINTARRMSGEAPWAPKHDAQFHFEMPDSLQGFTVTQGEGEIVNCTGLSLAGERTLRLSARGATRFGTPVFSPSKEFSEWTEKSFNPYPLMASPRVFPGQIVSAQLVDGAGAAARLYVAYYDSDDEQQIAYSDTADVDDSARLSFEIPQAAYPAYEVGIETSGTVHLDYLRWDGEPSYVSQRADGPRRSYGMLRRSWVNGVDEFVAAPWVRGYKLVQNDGRGLLIQGTRHWRDVTVTADVCTDMAAATGVAVRVQGMRRYYALLLCRGGDVRIVKVAGGETLLASQPFPWAFGESYEMSLAAAGDKLTGYINGEAVLTATDAELACGGIALAIEEGSTATNRVCVEPT